MNRSTTNRVRPLRVTNGTSLSVLITRADVWYVKVIGWRLIRRGRFSLLYGSGCRLLVTLSTPMWLIMRVVILRLKSMVVRRFLLCWKTLWRIQSCTPCALLKSVRFGRSELLFSRLSGLRTLVNVILSLVRWRVHLLLLKIYYLLFCLKFTRVVSPACTLNGFLSLMKWRPVSVL